MRNNRRIHEQPTSNIMRTTLHASSPNKHPKCNANTTVELHF